MSLCEGCHAGCCRAFAVPITGSDMISIERETGKTFWDFACRWEDPDGSIAANYAPHFFFRDEPETPFVICLKHEESSIFKNSSRCHFLMETPPDAEHPLGLGKCSIYHARPSACRVFPTKFDTSQQLPIIHSVPEYGREEKSKEYRLCPRPWTSRDVDPIQMTHDLVVARYEVSFFRQLAELWNQKVGEWSVFPEFLRNVYANRVQEIPQHTSSQESPHILKISDYQAPLSSADRKSA